MDLSTLSILLTIGIACIGSYDKMQKEHDSGNFHPCIDLNKLGALVGTILSIGILIYTFIHFKWWYPVAMAFSSRFLTYFILIIFSKILGKTYSRLILIWVLPMIAIIYLIIRSIPWQ